MTSYYFNIITSQFKYIPLMINVLNSNITSIYVVNSATDIMLSTKERFISFDSQNNLTSLIFSINNITNVAPTIFNFLKIIYYSIETVSNINSVYICKTDTDYVICTGLLITGGTQAVVPPPPPVTTMVGVSQQTAIDTGPYSISTSYIPKTERNVTTKNYVDSSILLEQQRAMASENYLLQITNYNKIIKPSFAVKNTNGSPDGSFPFDMSDQMISAGYDGWYFNNILPTNFINWTFYSNFNINTGQLSSISFNLYLLPSIGSYNIPSISVYTKPLVSSPPQEEGSTQTSLYHDCTTYTIDPAVLSTLTPGYYYTFYALTAPPITPNHVQIPLSVASVTYGPGEVQTSTVYDILNFNVTTDQSSTFIYNLILSQFTIVTSYGNENMIMSNDSIYSVDTRSRLNIIFDFFFETDSSINPNTGLSILATPADPNGADITAPLACPNDNFKFLHYNAYSQTYFDLRLVSDPYSFIFLNFSSNPTTNGPVSTMSLSVFKLKKYFNYKIQFSTDCLATDLSMTGMYYISTGSSSNAINTISNASIYNGPAVPYYRVNSLCFISSSDSDVYLSVIYLGQQSSGTFSNTNLLIEFN